MIRPRIQLGGVSLRRLQSTLKVAIVGSGPSGFYTAHDLLKKPNVQVTMFEKLPTPFGLSRYGVAPDHPEVKNCEETFTEAAENDLFEFVGNVEVGKDVSIEHLQKSFNGVVFAYGCDQGNKLGIKGEDSAGVINAHEFVAWYNGNPNIWNTGAPPLDRVENVVIIGNGNVAMDIARILLMPVEDLEHTDIASHAVSLLKKSTVKNIRIVARRGFVESAFTTKEIRELLQLEQYGVKFDGIDQQIVETLLPLQKKLERVQKRKLTTVLEYMKPASERKGKLKYVVPSDVRKSWSLDYLLSPIEIKSNDKDTSLVSEIVFQKNRLHQDSPEGPVQVQHIPNNYETIKTDLVITSLGFKGSSLNGFEELGIQFDRRRGVIVNDSSRVLDNTNEVIPGLYASGWIKNAKKGPILNALVDSNAVTEAIMKDYESGAIRRDAPGLKGLELPKDHTNWRDWQTLDSFELAFGQSHDKHRWKVPRVSDMLEIIEDNSTQDEKLSKFKDQLEAL